MVNGETRYLDLMREILYTGEEHDDRTGTGTRRLFARSWSHDLREGFPLLTTKQMAIKNTFLELMWFISGSTNVNDLPPSVQPWWRPWARADGELGPTYGAQWRSARSWLDDPETGGQKLLQVDQLAELVKSLTNNPGSRRHIMTSWSACDSPRTGLPPCHGALIQCNVRRGYILDMRMSQRSADWFIGVPVNIASYALFLSLLSKITGYTPGVLTIEFGDLHVYNDHREQCAEQLTREPRPLPKLRIGDDLSGGGLIALENAKWSDITVENYDPYPAIKAPVAV